MYRPVLYKLSALMLCAICLPAFAHEGIHDPMPQPPLLAMIAPSAEMPTDAATCAVTIRAVDGASGELLPALIHITDGKGRTIRPAELLPRSAALTEKSTGEAAFAYVDRWFILPGERTLELPQRATRIEAFSGLETTVTSQSLDLTGQTSAHVDLALSRFRDLNASGERLGNVHLHLRDMSLPEAERYVTETAAADGLDLVFLSYLQRPGADAQYISNTFTTTDLQRFRQRSGVLFGYGEEYRHNFRREEGYGHVMFLDLPRRILPASLGPDIMKTGNDDGVLRTGIQAARQQAATILWCHNGRGHEDIPSWVSGLLDGQIIFDGGATGGYERGFYRYLNVGLHVPIAMGTDWFINDMAMTCVRAPAPLTTASWLESLREGRSWITNGPLLDFSVDGAQPGAVIAPGTEGTVRVRAQGVCRNDFLALELVANGAVINSARSEAGDGVFKATLDLEVPIATSTWLALRTVPFSENYDSPAMVSAAFNEYGRPLFAHTSPIYVQVAGKSVFVPEAAESLIAELRSSLVTIRRAGVYSSERERNRVLALYEEAIAKLGAPLGR